MVSVSEKKKDDTLKSTTDKTLGIKHGVAGVHGSLVLCGITNQTLFRRKGNVGRRSSVSLYKWMYQPGQKIG